MALEADADHSKSDDDSTKVLQIQGSYVGTIGTIIVGQEAKEDQIALTFQQVGAEVTASYQSTKGAQGRGKGIVVGNAIKAMSILSEKENCPGSFTASLTFSDEDVTWTYTGRDCSGPQSGYCAARKTKAEPEVIR